MLAAGAAYVASEFLKKGADSAIDATYKRVVSFFKRKLGHDLKPADLEQESLARAQIDQDPEVAALNREIISHSSALRRARFVGSLLSGAHILWVDDLPANNDYECRVFRSFGVKVDQARSSEGAFARLQNHRYDLILSDMSRDDLADAGLRFLEQLRSTKDKTPIMFYVGSVDESRGVPPGAFGIADKPELLIHLVLDVVERRRV
jgi:CheY-like chemotaxis protein